MHEMASVVVHVHLSLGYPPTPLLRALKKLWRVLFYNAIHQQTPTFLATLNEIIVHVGALSSEKEVHSPDTRQAEAFHVDL